MSLLRAILERLPGSFRMGRGMAFALGEIAAADLPACNASRDAEERWIPGGTGVADRRVTCEKDAADAYAWEDKGAAVLDAFLTSAEGDAAYVNVAGDTMTGNLRISSAAPIYYWNESDAAADNRLWRAYADAAAWKLAAINDAESAETFVLTATRSGSTVTGVGINAPLTIGNGGTPIAKVLSGTATFDPPSLANGATAQLFPVTVTGAVIGDTCIGSFTSLAQGGVHVTAAIYATDTGVINIRNDSGAAIDFGSGTGRITVLRF